MSSTSAHNTEGAASDTTAAFSTSALPGSAKPAGAGLSTAGPGDYFALMKPRVMSLVVFTAICGLLLAPGSLSVSIGWGSALIAIFCIALGAGASGALNMWYDADIDGAMARTSQRPIPKGVLPPRAALGFGMVMSGAAVWLLLVATNGVAAALLAFTIFFYLVIYTMWLKRSTPQNIVIGGAAGAFPPMVAYAAVTGTVTLDSALLFLIIFFWTPPHFWALALYKQTDYGRVGIPMMPNVKGAARTRTEILVYSLLLFGLTLLPWWTGLGGTLYGVAAVGLGAVFVGLAWRVFRSQAGDKPSDADAGALYAVRSGNQAARNLFAYSILYLFAIFGMLTVDHLLVMGA
nr:heme o synthase [uncultured Algimonas sp.]